MCKEVKTNFLNMTLSWAFFFAFSKIMVFLFLRDNFSLIGQKSVCLRIWGYICKRILYVFKFYIFNNNTFENFDWKGEVKSVCGERVGAVSLILYVCSHEIRRQLLLGRKAMINLDNVLKSKDTTLPTEVRIVWL